MKNTTAIMQSAITELMAHIERAQLAIRSLQVFEAPSEPGSVVAAAQVEEAHAAGREGQSAKGRGQSGKGKAAGAPRASTGVTGLSRAENSKRMVKAAEGLGKSFDNAALCAAAGSKTSNTTNYIGRWKRWGWVTVKDGRYLRTEKWGKERTTDHGLRTMKPSEPAVVSGQSSVVNPSDLAKLRKDLEQALAQRDHARLNGRDEMVKLFQADVDRFEAALGQG